MERCGACSSEAVRRVEIGLHRSVGRWLRYGRRRTTDVLRCADCGETFEQGATAGLTLLSATNRRDAPKLLLQGLRRNRTIEPAPATYLGLAVAGTALAVAMGRRSRVRWWHGAAAAPLLGCATTLATALRHTPIGGEPWWVDAARVLRPEWSARREQERLRDGLRQLGVPLYAGDGPARLGGHAWSGAGMVSVDVITGRTEVTTAPRGFVPWQDRLLEQFATELAHLEIAERQVSNGGPHADLDAFERCSRDHLERLRRKAWSEEEAVLAGTTHPALSLVEQGRTLLGVELGDHVVTVLTDRPPSPPITLRQVAVDELLPSR